jgi:hypothetical protein
MCLAALPAIAAIGQVVASYSASGQEASLQTLPSSLRVWERCWGHEGNHRMNQFLRGDRLYQLDGV